MLKLAGAPFTQGRSKFSDHHNEHPEATAKIFVRLLVGNLDTTVTAQLDTGAAWSILDPKVASVLGLFDAEGFPAIIDTRFGRTAGRLVKVPVRFLADEGTSFDTEGTFFVSPDWPPGRTFLGYSGLLDSIRFALDPQKNNFYFGAGL